MSISNPIMSINGVIGAQVSPLDRGLAYGDGLFETCRILAHSLPLWPLHEDRLAEGCQRLHIPLDREKLNVYLQDLMQIGGLSDGILKVIVTRGPGGRGYRAPEQVEPSYCLAIFPTAIPAEPLSGITVRVCQQRLAINPSLAGIKHLNRLEQVLARAEWQDESIAEGLLLNSAGQVIEATAANLMIVRAGELITPDLSFTGVAGVARRLILEQLARNINLPAQVVAINLEDIYSADEMFLCNSILGIRPVTKLLGDDIQDFKIGPKTLELHAAFEAYLHRTGLSASESL